MCSISVEPRPSITSTPKCAAKRRPISAGSASPAEEHSRSATASRAGRLGEAKSAAYPVGAPHKIVGRWAQSRAPIASGVGRPAIKITVAPTLSGKVNALPRP